MVSLGIFFFYRSLIVCMLQIRLKPLRHRKSNDTISVCFGEQEQCAIKDTPPSEGQGPSSVLDSRKCAMQQCHNATILPDQEADQVAINTLADAEEQMKLLAEEQHTEEGVQWDQVAEHMLHNVTEKQITTLRPPLPLQSVTARDPSTIEQEEIEQLKGQMEKLQQEINEQLRLKKEEEAAATEAKCESEQVEDQALNIAKRNKVLRNMLDELKLPQKKGAQCDDVVGAPETSELENKSAKMTAILRTKRQKLKQEKEKLEIARRKNRTWKEGQDSAKRQKNPESNASNQAGK